jgi:hypothetical protein
MKIHKHPQTTINFPRNLREINWFSSDSFAQKRVPCKLWGAHPVSRGQKHKICFCLFDHSDSFEFEALRFFQNRCSQAWLIQVTSHLPEALKNEFANLKTIKKLKCQSPFCLFAI